MNIEEWKHGRQLWAPVIGRLLLAFGEIEYCLIICLGPLDGHHALDKLKASDFKKKASESLRVLSINHSARPGAKRAIQLLNQAIKLAEYRNLVAHNPLTIGAYTDEMGDIQFRLVVSSLRNHKKSIALSDLQEVAEATECVAAELHNTIYDLWTQRE